MIYFDEDNDRKFDVPVLDGVSARLDIWTARASRQPSLRHLHGRLFVGNALLQQLYVLLHVEDLLHHLSGSDRTRSSRTPPILVNVTAESECMNTFVTDV